MLLVAPFFLFGTFSPVKRRERSREGEKRLGLPNPRRDYSVPVSVTSVRKGSCRTFRSSCFAVGIDSRVLTDVGLSVASVRNMSSAVAVEVRGARGHVGSMIRLQEKM